ncbi:MAG: nuclear transport factor 2 family protein, partial [Pseudomonadota bacterium]
MQGFDAQWRDPGHYIIGITKEIWEDRNLHTLRHYYGDAMAVRTPASIVVGNRKVIGATMATLAEWPDRRLLGEDVIWSPIRDGEGPKANGFLSSHRLLCTATHSRPGAYGDPTGKVLRYRVLADCAAQDNAIFDEWLIRDQGAIARQIGRSPREFAIDLIAREGGIENAVRPFHPDHDEAVQYTGRGNDHEIGARHADIL